ncbi:MAG TPA: hypothetical protein VFV87_18995 [Pirellulaceae bacterium]|nr:hypothetical protein [Pirellulaceae bacterium]
MKLLIRLTKGEEARALPILLRRSPGVVLQDRTYLSSGDAVEALRQAGIRFGEISGESSSPGLIRLR